MSKAAGVYDLRMGNEKVVSLLVGGGAVPLERGTDQSGDRDGFVQVGGRWSVGRGVVTVIHYPPSVVY